MVKIPVLDFIRKMIAGSLTGNESTIMRYPTAISQTLGFRIVEIDKGTATIEVDANNEKFGNQQGTIHGGFLCELADAAIGTAHSTLMNEGESFTSIELKINFFRPVWKEKLRAVAKPIQNGKTLTHYSCDIIKEDGKLAAIVISTVMTLRGEKAQGR
ncbi:PaaI family thioesterase [Xenorhabdus sp. Flor]|uniref:PaaI family thioesterase n=1 Tax=Xenorhabdus cabanillasii TaxID=351673 RepID=UPI0019A84B10|nr:PaaI family thioesterase [Xenorhabdus sp. Flor]MBD2814421.1 PaaI family thioesterase [Xenorhabdus sp. Flor]